MAELCRAVGLRDLFLVSVNNDSEPAAQAARATL